MPCGCLENLAYPNIRALAFEGHRWHTPEFKNTELPMRVQKFTEKCFEEVRQTLQKNRTARALQINRIKRLTAIRTGQLTAQSVLNEETSLPDKSPLIQTFWKYGRYDLLCILLTFRKSEPAKEAAGLVKAFNLKHRLPYTTKYSGTNIKLQKTALYWCSCKFMRKSLLGKKPYISTLSPKCTVPFSYIWVLTVASLWWDSTIRWN